MDNDERAYWLSGMQVRVTSRGPCQRSRHEQEANAEDPHQLRGAVPRCDDQQLGPRQGPRLSWDSAEADSASDQPIILNGPFAPSVVHPDGSKGFPLPQRGTPTFERVIQDMSHSDRSTVAYNLVREKSFFRLPKTWRTPRTRAGRAQSRRYAQRWR